MRKLCLIASASMLAFNLAFAQWTYDPSTKVLADNTTRLNANVNNDSELTITKCLEVGAILDFSTPVTDSFGTNYSIVAINGSVFKSKTQITKLIYPATIRTINGEAFSGCSGITEVHPALVPDSVTSFNTSGRGVYEGCTSITQDFRIGYSPITTGGGQWFARTKVAVADFGPYITTIPSYCFENTPVKELRLSEGLVHFYGGSGKSGSLTNIVNAFPSTLKTLNWCEVFRGNANLQVPEIRLENVTSLDANFYGSKVPKIWFGPGIVKFPSNLFQGNNHVTNMTICATNAITSIGSAAFSDMDEMQEFTFMGPAQSTSILNTIFANITDLRPVAYVSKFQQGWYGLTGLVTDKAAIAASLSTEQQETYASRLSDPDLIGIYPVNGNAKKRIWIIHRKSIYDSNEDLTKKHINIITAPNCDAATVPAQGTSIVVDAGAQLQISTEQYASDGNAPYVCTGWALEYIDPQTGLYVTDISGSEISTTLTIPSNDHSIYRLRWIYEEVPETVCLTISTSGVEPIIRSIEPIVSHGYKNWYAKGSTVSITAKDVSEAPKSEFRYWLISGETVFDKTLVLNCVEDMEIEPVYLRHWLYDNATKTISSGDAKLKVSASGTELTITTGHAQVPKILDLSTSVTDIDGINYSIVAIDGSAFKSKTQITKLIYPATIRTIKGEAFHGCSGITEVHPALVPDSVTSFNTSGRGVYEGCTSITQDFRIGYSPITTGGGQWFARTKVAVADFGPYITTIPSYCFENTPVKELRLSEGLVHFYSGSGVQGSLTNIVNAFPSTLKTLNANNVFRMNANLQVPEIRIENVTSFSANFSGSNVPKIWFGPNIVNFPSYLFERNNHVTNMTICATNAITSIGSAAFADMDEMQEFTFMGPAQSTSILNTIFANITDLRPVAYVSRNQGGWDELSGLITDRDAIRQSLTEAQCEQFSALLSNDRLIGIYPVNGNAKKRIWLVHRASIYDKGGMTIFIR